MILKLPCDKHCCCWGNKAVVAKPFGKGVYVLSTALHSCTAYRSHAVAVFTTETHTRTDSPLPSINVQRQTAKPQHLFRWFCTPPTQASECPMQGHSIKLSAQILYDNSQLSYTKNVYLLPRHNETMSKAFRNPQHKIVSATQLNPEPLQITGWVFSDVHNHVIYGSLHDLTSFPCACGDSW